MSYSVHWTPLAESSYNDELEFILLKWNAQEVVKFINLTQDFITLLQNNPFMGKYIAAKNVYSFVLSKQTTLYYQLHTESSKLNILLFHNNSRDSNYLIKYL